MFPQRYVAEVATGAPGYRDLLIVLLVVLIGIIGYLVTRMGQKGTAHTLQLVTLRPRNIVTLGDFRVPLSQYVLGVLFAVIQLSLFLLFLSQRMGGDASEGFWLLFGKIAFGVIAFFGAQYLFMAWTGFTFAEKSQTELWLVNVALLFILYGISLTVPVFLLVFSPITGVGALAVGGLFYLVYRCWFVVRGLAVMPKLSRAPLLIILYLCTCEIAPIYLAYSILRYQ